MDEFTPRDAMRRGFPWIPVIGVGLVLFCLALWAIIHFGFAVDTANQQHQVGINNIKASAFNNNVGVQQSYIQQALTDIKDATAPGVSSANASYDAADACYQISNIDVSMPATLTRFAADNCNGSQLSATSKFYQP